MLPFCRRHLAQATFFRGPSLAFTRFTPPPLRFARLTITTRSHIPLLRPACLRPFTSPTTRWYSTESSIPTSSSQFHTNITPEEHAHLLEYAEMSWPPPPSIPPTWSCTWSEWERLLTYYWFSPLYLMLPQIELLVNIEYGIPGETRPVLFSNERQSFVMAIGNKYFLLDGPARALYRVKNVRKDQELVDLLTQGDDALASKLTAVEKNGEGKAAILRILKRDETVIPLLEEKFLSYAPMATTSWMETNDAPSSVEQEARHLEELARMEGKGDSDHLPGAGDAEKADALRKLDEEAEQLTGMISRLLEETDREDLGEDEKLKRNYNALLERIDATIKEMEAFEPSLPNHQHVYVDFLRSTKDVREVLSVDELPPEVPLEDAYLHAMEFAADTDRNFARIKNNPQVLNKVKIPEP